MGSLRKRLKKLQLPLMFAAFVFLIMIITMAITAAFLFLLSTIGILKVPFHGMPFVIFGFGSLMVGTILSVALSHRPLAPIRTLERAVEKIADGDFSVRVHLKGPDELTELGEKFNHMAEELGSVELLRSDFVNNFSHEFKTPIVSIRGFAQALKWGGLTDEERTDYLDIIIQESERLSDLSTRVLLLSKIEQQTILTNQCRLNVSEQIRLAIALLDRKWSARRLTFELDAEEIYLTGNEALLKEVWINLLDNAIKFSPEGGCVAVRITQSPGAVTVRVTNQGTPITDEIAAHLFDKFYQGDPSHTTRGNGLGLAIVRRIVALHGGTIRLCREDTAGNTFEAVLPVSDTQKERPAAKPAR